MKTLSFFLTVLFIASPIWPLGHNPIPGDPFLIVHVSDKTLTFINDEKVQATYPVAIGKEGDETPQGVFQVIVKAENPYYRKLDIEGDHLTTHSERGGLDLMLMILTVEYMVFMGQIDLNQ